MYVGTVNIKCTKLFHLFVHIEKARYYKLSKT